MIKLYQYEACPFCWKVRAFLQYKGLSYEKIEVHPLNKKEIAFSEDYRKVPILIGEDGEQVNDSSSIIRYLDEKYPEKPVFSKSQEEEKWLSWTDETLVRALPPLLYQSFSDALKAFHYITKVASFNWLQKRFIKYSGALVMMMVARKKAKELQITDPEAHIRECLAQWEIALNKKLFMGGDKPNSADISAYGFLKSIEALPAFHHIKDNRQIFQWYQRVDAQC